MANEHGCKWYTGCLIELAFTIRTMINMDSSKTAKQVAREK